MSLSGEILTLGKKFLPSQHPTDHPLPPATSVLDITSITCCLCILFSNPAVANAVPQCSGDNVCRTTFSPYLAKVHRKNLCTFAMQPSPHCHLPREHANSWRRPLTFPKPATHLPTRSGGNLGPKESRKSGACNFDHVIIFADPTSNPMLANDLNQASACHHPKAHTFLRAATFCELPPASRSHLRGTATCLELPPASRSNLPPRCHLPLPRAHAGARACSLVAR
jgi:hypothetical protein